MYFSSLLLYLLNKGTKTVQAVDYSHINSFGRYKLEKISISIVEDYLLTRISYRHSLSQAEDFEVVGDYENAEDCIKDMEKRQVDIVLMDLGLPFMNGIEATRIIKERYPQTNVIILTSHESEEEVLACMSSGASGYALKELNFDILKKVIRVVHFGALWFDPQIANVPLSAIPKPNSTDFDNLYRKSDIKSSLTERELEVLRLVVEGKSNVEIAEAITVSTNTAKAHVGNILSKLSVSDRVQAAVLAVRANLF